MLARTRSAPTGDLPDITQPVVIDGTTQPGYAGTPLIEINGQNAGTAFGLVVNGSNSIVRGLAINRFHHVGIVLSGAGGHRLEANFIGTNTSGTAALGNLEQGVFISSPNNVIGGATAAERNVISGNTAQGVIILGAGGDRERRVRQLHRQQRVGHRPDSQRGRRRRRH